MTPRTIPKRPTGSDDFHQWAQVVHDRVFKKLRFNNSPTVKVNEREHGFDFEAAPAGRAGSGGGVNVYQMTVVSESNDYVTCTYNCPGNALDGTSASVAKPPELRGFTATNAQAQSICPQYVAGNTIFAASPIGGTGVASVTLQDVNVTPRVLASNYQMTVVSESNDYITCTYNCPGYTFNGTSVSVAKPPELRGFTATTTDAQGTAQSIYPPYTAGKTIFAVIPIGGTGVTSVTLQDVNVTPRVLATSLGTCENVGGVPTQKSRLFYCSTYF
jgi:uncharacterized membrane protein